MNEKLRVLMVEDQMHMRILLRKMLSGLEMVETIEEAASGIQAWNRLSRGGVDIDLVICDVNMPEMDGFTFVEQCRTRRDLQHLPYIMTTGDPTMSLLANILDSGAWDCLVKPFSYGVMKKHLEAVMAIARSPEIEDFWHAEALKTAGLHAQALSRVDELSRNCHSFLRPRTYNLKGECFMLLAQIEKAITWFERAIDACEVWMPAYDNYAAAQEKLGNLDKAIQTVKQAWDISKNTKREFVLKKLQSCWEKQQSGEPENGAGAGAANLEGDDLFTVGKTFLQHGRYDKAEEVFMRMAEKRPAPLMVYENLCIALSEQGKNDQASRYYDMGLRDHPNNPFLLYRYGLFHLKQGDKTRAARFLRRAILFDPGLEDARDALKQVEG